jgi:hypothetical protein
MSDEPEPAPAQREVLEPVADDGVRAATVGTVLWVVAGLACLLLRDELASRDSLWWAWTCVAGLGVGLVILWVARRRARAYRAHRAATMARRASDDPA